MLTDNLSMLGKSLQGSEIRRLFAVSMRPEVISLAGGLPDPDSFPSDKVADTLRDLVRAQGSILLQYGASQGSESGIEAARHRLRARGITAAPEEIQVTAGAQQAIELAARVLVDPGDVVLVENPTFIGTLGTFRNVGAHIVGVPIDEDGLVPETLEATIRSVKDSGRRIKILYTIPHFQNPSGVTLSLERKRKILRIAEEHGIVILEDDSYGELYFDDTPEKLQPFKSLDSTGQVIYTGSFSKILSPGLRLGWAAASAGFVERFDMAKQMLDVCTQPLVQALAAALCEEGFIDEHVIKLRSVYRSRCAAMLGALDRYMPENVHWTKPRGGFYVWVTLPEKLDAVEMLDAALANNVAYVVGTAFTPDKSMRNTLRVSFCHENEATIEEGIKRLGRTVSAALASQT